MSETAAKPITKKVLIMEHNDYVARFYSLEAGGNRTEEPFLEIGNVGVATDVANGLEKLGFEVRMVEKQ